GLRGAGKEWGVGRGSLVQVAGARDPAVGGPDIDFNRGLSSRRRSLYLTHHGEGRMPFLELFDAPEACEAYTRTVSVIPQQALALTNNELAHSLSRDLAKRLWHDCPRVRGSCRAEIQSRWVGASHSRFVPATHESVNVDFITAAFEQILNRRPAQSEVALSLAFLKRQEHLF